MRYLKIRTTSFFKKYILLIIKHQILYQFDKKKFKILTVEYSKSSQKMKI